MAAELDPKFAAFKKRLDVEEEKEKQRRQYGFYLPNPGQNPNQKQNNQVASSNQTPGNQSSSNTQPATNKNNQSQSAATNTTNAQSASNQSTKTQNTSPQSNQPGQSIPGGQNNAAMAQNNANQPDTTAYKQENKSGPVTQNRRRRNIVVTEDGKISETDIKDGLVQNRNVKIVMQPDFLISIFNKDSVDFNRLQYYNMEVEALNNKNNNDPFLIISNKPFAYQPIHKDSFKSMVENWSNEISSNKKVRMHS